MPFNLRLHGRTACGIKCRADISVYANSQAQLRQEATAAAQNAPWRELGPKAECIPEGEHITIEYVESLDQ